MKGLRFLLLEDSLLDGELIGATLSDGKIECELVRVETRADFVREIETDSFDLILADYSLPSFDGLSALEIAKNTCPDLPFIFVSGSLGEELAIESLKSGATDYVVKERLGRLVPSVMRALREAQERRELKLAEEQRMRLLARVQRKNQQLRGLTEAANLINTTLSVEEVLKVIAEQARSIVGTHQSVINLVIDQNWAQSIHSISLSDKYALWRDYDEKPSGSGIYAYVCQSNRPMRMTQAELEAHPMWRGFGKEAGKHPPMRGWLAAPLIRREGRNIGLIQLSDKYEGEFTEADEDILVQLAQMASVAIENTRLYEAEQKARTQAEAANRIKDEFLAVLSHELRSPLNPILGWSKLLRTSKLDRSTVERALETIERNARLQIQLIEDLLDVSRIIQGKLSLNISPVDLKATIEAAMETVRFAAEVKSIEIQTLLRSDIGRLSGDPSRLQQVVWNLLSNAVKFTPSGGRVEVKLERVVSFAQFQVSDTGKGINSDFLPYIFDSFRQADSSTTRKFGGLGLGLAIVRHLVELHGGTVEADSPGEGQGATFTVKLPLMIPNPETVSDDKPPKCSSDLRGLRVLVVDDDADTLELIAFMLERCGAIVTPVATAIEALQILAHSEQDVLVSDIGMPEMDGYMLMRQIRSLPPAKGGQIPAIALTAYAGEMNQKQALKAGFQRHLTKPVEQTELIEIIASLSDRTQPQTYEELPDTMRQVGDVATP